MRFRERFWVMQRSIAVVDSTEGVWRHQNWKRWCLTALRRLKCDEAVQKLPTFPRSQSVSQFVHRVLLLRTDNATRRRYSDCRSARCGMSHYDYSAALIDVVAPDADAAAASATTTTSTIIRPRSGFRWRRLRFSDVASARSSCAPFFMANLRRFHVVRFIDENGVCAAVIALVDFFRVF